jgi:hypothetical protein
MQRVPSGQLDRFSFSGDLDHLGVLAGLAVLADGLHPRFLGHVDRRVGHLGGEVETDGELDAPLPQCVQEAMGAAGRVGPGQHRHPVLGVGHLGAHRQLGQRQVQDLHVVGCGVGPGISRAKHRRQGFVGGVQPATERMKAKAVLVIGRGVLLLGVSGEQGGVEVQHVVAGVGSRLPGPGPGLRPSGAHCRQAVRIHRVDHPPRRGVRCHGSEQTGLVAQRGEIAQRRPAVGQHQCHIHQHVAGIVL